MNPSRVFLQQIFLAFFVILLPSAASFAQSNPSEPLRVVLKGHDPVAYFTVGRPVKGIPEFKYDWDGERYLFANAGNRDKFAANPERYAPQFGGYCTGSMSRGVRNEGHPEAWVIVDGRLYVFGAPDSATAMKTKENAEKDVGAFRVKVAAAAKNWGEKK